MNEQEQNQIIVEEIISSMRKLSKKMELLTFKLKENLDELKKITNARTN